MAPILLIHPTKKPELHPGNALMDRLKTEQPDGHMMLTDLAATAMLNGDMTVMMVREPSVTDEQETINFIMALITARLCVNHQTYEAHMEMDASLMHRVEIMMETCCDTAVHAFIESAPPNDILNGILVGAVQNAKKLITCECLDERLMVAKKGPPKTTPITMN